MLGHYTYVVFELVWALPVVAIQWVLGFRFLWKRRAPLFAAVAATTAYLSCADGVAIGQGIWMLHSDRIVGIYIANVPLEEVIFFVVTNTMVAQSILIFSASPLRLRKGQLIDPSTR